MPLEAWIAIGAALFVVIFLPMMNAMQQKEEDDSKDQG
jgi:hypothetical protein